MKRGTTLRLGVAAALVDGQFVGGDVEVEDGRIARCGLASPNGRGLAVPGFVDLQVNGFGGVDFLDADADGYRRAGEALLETGVTAYLPTLITSPEETLLAALARGAGRRRRPAHPRRAPRGAVPLAPAARNARRGARAATPTWRCSTGCSTAARSG